MSAQKHKEALKQAYEVVTLYEREGCSTTEREAAVALLVELLKEAHTGSMDEEGISRIHLRDDCEEVLACIQVRTHYDDDANGHYVVF